ncbi:MAG: sodium:sulfate symporter [Gammaproteobacteria bacterium]|nr:MAG: sodium:sulfate symporter [Gammaproteobacteria bacterium]
MIIEPLSLHAIAVMVFTIIGLYLFSRDWIPIETTGLFILVVMISMFYFFPYEVNGVSIDPAYFFFSSFGHEALVTICALLAIGKAIEISGSLQPLVVFLSKSWIEHPKVSFLGVLLFGAFTSAFINNTPIVVILIPALIAVARKTNMSSSKILMPMGMATLIGGMTTTIGTSTNLLVVGISRDMGLQEIQLFDFVVPALIAGSIGMVFLWLVAPRYLSDRQPRESRNVTRLFEAILHVNEDSYPNGKTLAELIIKVGDDFQVQKIKRSESLFVAKIPTVVIEAGDQIYIKDTIEKLKEYESLLGVTLYHDEDVTMEDGSDQKSDNTHLAEVVVGSGSLLDQQTLNTQKFIQRFNLLPLAIHRSRTGSEVVGDITSKQLNVGDVLLVQGTDDAINNLRTNTNLLIIDGSTLLFPQSKTALPLYIMLGVAVAAGTGLMPISISALVGLAALLVTKSLKWGDVGDAMNIPIIMLIVASLCLGNALEVTGGSDFLANAFVFVTQSLPIPVIISALMLIMAIITNIVSNNAAAVIGTPIAISIAQQLGAPVEPFILAVLFGANMSFVTPIGYKTNLLIMGAGDYRFSDFVRIGLPLAVIMWLTLSIVLPLLYPM